MKTTIAAKLSVLFLLMALAPMTVVSFLSYRHSVETTKDLIQDSLASYAETKARHINTYFDERRKDVTSLVHAPVLISALPRLNSAYQHNGADSPEYRAVESEVSAFLKFSAGLYSYYNLFLVSPAGDVVFSIKHEDDFLSNLRSGPYKDTELAHSFEGAATLLETSVSDFRYYPPSEKPAAFVAAPVCDDGVVVGVLAAQMDTQEIYKLLRDYTGLGKSAEIVIASRVGDQALFMNPLRHDPEAAFSRKVTLGSRLSFPIQQAVQGKKGIGIYDDYRGREVLAAWRYLPDLRLGLVVKQDSREAFLPVNRLRNESLAWAGAALLFLTCAALLLSRGISSPIKELTRAAEQMASGKMDTRARVRTSDEIGALANSFNRMLDHLQQQAEFLTRLSSELEIIMDSIPGLVFYKDTENHYLRVNQFVADAHKTSKEALEGKSLFDLYPAKEAQAYFDDDLEVITSGIPKLNIDEPWETESGIRWVSTSKIPYTNETGKVVGVIGVSMDITERRKAEEEVRQARDSLQERVRERTADLEAAKKHAEELNAVLSEREEDLRTTLASIGDGVITVDRESRVVRLNLAGAALTGWTPEEAQGRNLDEVFHILNEETRKTVSAPVARVLETGTIEGLANHTILVSRDGTERGGCGQRGAGPQHGRRSYRCGSRVSRRHARTPEAARARPIAGRTGRAH